MVEFLGIELGYISVPHDLQDNDKKNDREEYDKGVHFFLITTFNNEKTWRPHKGISREAAYAFIHKKFKMDQTPAEQTVIDLLYSQRDKLAEWHIENRCVNVNYKDNRGDSMLTVAAWNGFDGIIQLLLLKGANIHIRNKYYSSAIIEACRSGRTEIVELLLAYGARIDDTDGFGFNPLMTAAKEGFYETVFVLLANGADPKYRITVPISVYHGWTPLIAAARFGHLEIVELLMLKEVDINEQSSSGDCPLILATCWNHIEIVKLLLRHGADPNKQNANGNCALIAAARERLPLCASILLEMGADVNLKNRNGTTALMMATARDHIGIVKLLLINGANIHDEDNDGKKAIENTDREDIEEVIDKWQVTTVITVLQDLQIEHCLDYDFYKDLQEFGLDEKKPVVEEEGEDYDVVADY
jgi:ankyrin repeat protein